ncbi:MAG: hypothetical protein F4170_08365 [Rhodobacteraceae bacterium]|nr:hypothetical protein [Paracoccaceae bacterium]
MVCPLRSYGKQQAVVSVWGVVIPGWKKWPDRRHRDGYPGWEDTGFHACTIPNSRSQRGHTAGLYRVGESGMRATGCLNVGPS